MKSPKKQITYPEQPFDIAFHPTENILCAALINGTVCAYVMNISLIKGIRMIQWISSTLNWYLAFKRIQSLVGLLIFQRMETVNDLLFI